MWTIKVSDTQKPEKTIMDMNPQYRVWTTPMAFNVAVRSCHPEDEAVEGPTFAANQQRDVTPNRLARPEASFELDILGHRTCY